MAALYSFSKLDTFVECPRNYFYTYIQGKRGGESVYTYMGSVAHDLAEGIDLGHIDNDTAVERFTAALDEVDMLGMQWISDRSKENYVECVSHFLREHQPSTAPNLMIEDVFAVSICDAILYGYIDQWYRTDNEVYITDYKTSSKFTGEMLEHKKIQLYIYAEALRKYYPDYRTLVQFNMMKYAKCGKALKPRNELAITSDYDEALVAFEYTDDCRRVLNDFVGGAVCGINSRDPSDINDWEMKRDPSKDFFCKSLCSHCDLCKRGG